MTANSPSEIRVGLCGAGGIVANHCEAIGRVDGIRVQAVSSRTATSARRAAKAYGIPTVYETHDQLIQSPDVDVVLIATPNYLHHPLAMQAIKKGKHVFVEKPLAMTLSEGREMVQAAAGADVALVYAEQLPLAPKFVRLCQWAREGAFGDVYMVRQIERHAGPPTPWFFEANHAGGGALADLGCHSISVVLDYFPNRAVEAVSGLIRTYQHRQGDVEDFAVVQLHFEGGALGVIEANWCHQGGMDSITEVFGSKGNGYADLMKGSGLTTYSETRTDFGRTGQGGWHHPPYDPVYEYGYQAQIQALVRVLRDGQPPVQSGQDGLAVLRIMEAAYRSAEQGSSAVALSEQ